MAISRTMVQKDDTSSIYDTRGILTI